MNAPASQSPAEDSADRREPARQRQGNWRRVWLWSALALAVLSSATAWTARTQWVAQHDALHEQTEAAIDHWGAKAQAATPDLLAPLDQLRDWWRRKLATDGRVEAFGSAAEHACSDIKDKDNALQMVGWVGTDGVCKVVYPNDPKSDYVGERISENGYWADAWDRAHFDGRDTIGVPRLGDSAGTIRIVLPIFDGDAAPDKFKGAIIARIGIERFASKSLVGLSNDYHAQIRDVSVVLFRWEPPNGVAPPPPPPSVESSELTSVKRVAMPGRSWEFRLTPTSAVVARSVDRSPHWILGSGLAVSLLTTGLVFQALRGRALHALQAQQHRRALEKLNEIATQVSARLDSPRDVLDHLASAARELLDMDRSVISLVDAPGGELKMVAFASDVSKEREAEFALHELPLSRQVLAGRQVLFVENVEREPASEHVQALREQGVASVVLIPLHVGERELGVMALSSRRARRFTSGERRLARLLGSTAAVILSNSELYARMGESMRRQQRLFEQREALFAVNAAVYQASSFQESLQMIAELAPGVLDVDLCMVTLIREDDDKMRVAAVTHPHGADLVGKAFVRKGTNGEIVRVTRRVLVVEDGRTHPGVHPAFRAQLDIGSIAYLPLLRSSGEFMGTLVLVRRMPGPFAAEQLNLAEIFTARAAAAVENAQLLDQTRRDAEAKTMLLRELNHRVKNNMASIITLLSLDEPELSRSARQWLDRAIARIRTMACAHGLFSGGMDRVPLVELVEQTIPSLSVIKPPGVTVRAELNGIRVMLRTDRAVSLAMVLHELCSNAIMHGLADSGTVTIRAQLKKTEKAGEKNSALVSIEVIDEGRDGAAAPKEARELALAGAARSGASFDEFSETSDLERGIGLRKPGAGGLGLILVRGLVARELGGTFSLSRIATGGSVARVEFPAGADETPTGKGLEI